MGDTEKGNIDLFGRFQSPFGPSPSSSNSQHQLLPTNHLDVSQLNLSQIRPQITHNLQNCASENGRRPPSHPQIPPISPYSQLPVTRAANKQMNVQNFSPRPTHSHSRSLSQSSFFNFDSLPPLVPSAYKDPSAGSGFGAGLGEAPYSVNGSVENHCDGGLNLMVSPLPPYVGSGSATPLPVATREGLPPRKHRRSMSDVPLGFNSSMLQSPPFATDGGGGTGSLQRTLSGGQCLGADNKPVQLVKKETAWGGFIDSSVGGLEGKKLDGETMDDFFAACINLDNIDLLNSNEKSESENPEDMDSKASNSKTNGGESSDCDAESSVIESGRGSVQAPGNGSTSERKEGLKRRAGGDIAPTVRHQRSISMDSFMGKLQLCDESPKLPPSAAGAFVGPVSCDPSSFGDNSRAVVGLEFRSGEFSGAEMKKIMENEKLAEIALTDPKRAKRILANRQSAARSKERKMRYISELEHKVQTLQTEATTLSSQLTMLQKDAQGLTTMNNELKLRLQALEQQAQLRDALNDTLTKEIQRLRVATGEMVDPRSRGCFMNAQMLSQLQQQQQISMQPSQDPSNVQDSSSSTKMSDSSASNE